MKRRKLTRRQYASYIGGGFLVAFTAAAIGIAATHIGWLITLAAIAVLAALVYLAARAWRRATRRVDQIFDDELG